MRSDNLAAHTILYVWCDVLKTTEVFMANPILRIINGPGQRDLEQAFLARKLGATARFTIIIDGRSMEVELEILDLEFVTCREPNYKLGGQISGVTMSIFVPQVVGPFDFIFVEYNTKGRTGKMTFLNAE